MYLYCCIAGLIETVYPEQDIKGIFIFYIVYGHGDSSAITAMVQLMHQEFKYPVKNNSQFPLSNDGYIFVSVQFAGLADSTLFNTVRTLTQFIRQSPLLLTPRG